MTIEIETATLEIHSNRNNHTVRHPLTATCKVSKDFIQKIDELALAKVREKFGFSRMTVGKIYLSKRLTENKWTACVEINIDDGDIISRVVYVEFDKVQFLPNC